MSVWLTIPTRGDRDNLATLIADCGIPRHRIVLVHTHPTSPDHPGCVNAHDYGPINIHRWWNLGIDTATAAGATTVVVANDDIRIGNPAAIGLLGMSAAPFAYVTPGRAGPRNLTGWAWAIRPHDTDIRPDEAFRWWYGDDDLELRARAAGQTLVAAAVDITHLGPSTSGDDPRFTSLIANDARLFTRRHLVL